MNHYYNARLLEKYYIIHSYIKLFPKIIYSHARTSFTKSTYHLRILFRKGIKLNQIEYYKSGYITLLLITALVWWHVKPKCKGSCVAITYLLNFTRISRIKMASNATVSLSRSGDRWPATDVTRHKHCMKLRKISPRASYDPMATL